MTWVEINVTLLDRILSRANSLPTTVSQYNESSSHDAVFLHETLDYTLNINVS